MVVNFHIDDETVLSESWFLWGALAFSFLLGAGIATFLWRTGKSIIELLFTLATSVVPDIIGFVADVFDLGSDVAACALIWTVDLPVVTEPLKLAYVIAVSIGAVPSLVMLFNRLRGVIKAMRINTKVARGKAACDVSAASLDSNAITIRDLILVRAPKLKCTCFPRSA
jgi:hypothetical protein